MRAYENNVGRTLCCTSSSSNWTLISKGTQRRVCRKTNLKVISGGHESHKRFDQFTKSILVAGGCVASNSREALEHSHHTLPVLRDEGPGLSLDLFIVHTPGEDGRDDDPNDGKQKTVIPPKGVRIVNICIN